MVTSWSMLEDENEEETKKKRIEFEFKSIFGPPKTASASLIYLILFGDFGVCELTDRQ